jgi:hypothetical protein
MVDFYDNINSGYYSNAGDYPAKPSCPILEDSLFTSADQASEYAAKVRAWSLAMDVWKAAVDAYNRRSRELEQEFQRDLEDHHGMTGHPKAAILFGKAWDRGHSAGYYDVALVYDDLVDLVK